LVLRKVQERRRQFLTTEGNPRSSGRGRAGEGRRLLLGAAHDEEDENDDEKGEEVKN